MKVSDYFAELFVAGRFADDDWNIYFPHRDRGFDFIATRPDGRGGQMVRPVQVKGKYPTEAKVDRQAYGYIGRLTQLHREMVLAIPFFSMGSPGTPTCVAYLPRSAVKPNQRGYRCLPARYIKGHVSPRKAFACFFDAAGLHLVASVSWGDEHL
jgi:hypothetical protein